MLNLNPVSRLPPDPPTTRSVLLSYKDGEDRTALHFAAHGGGNELVKWILGVLNTNSADLKAALDSQDSKGLCV